MTAVLLRNARVFDGVNPECPEGMQVLVEGGVIREMSSQPLRTQDMQEIDVGGRTLMPGLIDAHIHAYGSDLNVQKIELAGDAYRTAYAARMLGHALECGFTTVRDVGGGDWSLWRAIEDKLIRAPRFLYVGKFISMTEGTATSARRARRVTAMDCAPVTRATRCPTSPTGWTRSSRRHARSCDAELTASRSCPRAGCSRPRTPSG